MWSPSLFRRVVFGFASLMPVVASGQVGAPVASPPSAQQPLTRPASPLAPAAVPNEPTPKPNKSRDYVIGPADTLSLGVFGLPEFAQVARVSNSGKVHLTYLGIMTVSGKTVAQLESDIAGLLREKELVKEPWVVVQVTETRAHPVYILGEVMTPGQFAITDEMYLNDLVTLGQGFNEVATPVGFLYRRKVDTTPTDKPFDESEDGMFAIPIDFHALQTGLRPDLNIKLQGGDILYVPQKRKDFCFIIGEVASPGLIEIRGRQGFRLTQALAQVGGPTRRAKASDITLVRYDADNTRKEIAINFKKVLNGEEPDIELQFGDVVYVPGSKAKSAGMALVNILPGVAQQRVIPR